MVNWFKRKNEEPEEEPVSESESAEESESVEVGSEEDTSWLPDVSEVTLEIDGKKFLALSLYELPGVEVMAAQQAPDEQRLPALWTLIQRALTQEALDRMAILSFSDMQQVLFSWTLLSGQAAAEAYARKGQELVKKILGDRAEDFGFNADGSGGPDDDGRPGRSFYE